MRLLQCQYSVVNNPFSILYNIFEAAQFIQIVQQELLRQVILYSTELWMHLKGLLWDKLFEHLMLLAL